MNDDCKKWLCELAGMNCGKYDMGVGDCWDIEILIKAMWAINREGKWQIRIDDKEIITWANKREWNNLDRKSFYYKDHNNEQEALEAALEYIYEQEQK